MVEQYSPKATYSLTDKGELIKVEPHLGLTNPWEKWVKSKELDFNIKVPQIDQAAFAEIAKKWEYLPFVVPAEFGQLEDPIETMSILLSIFPSMESNSTGRDLLRLTNTDNSTGVFTTPAIQKPPYLEIPSTYTEKLVSEGNFKNLNLTQYIIASQTYREQTGLYFDIKTWTRIPNTKFNGKSLMASFGTEGQLYLAEAEDYQGESQTVGSRLMFKLD